MDCPLTESHGRGAKNLNPDRQITPHHLSRNKLTVGTYGRKISTWGYSGDEQCGAYKGKHNLSVHTTRMGP